MFELKLRTPKLKLISENDEEKITAEIFSVEQLPEIEVQNEINKMKGENPQIRDTIKPKELLLLSLMGNLTQTIKWRLFYLQENLNKQALVALKNLMMSLISFILLMKSI